MDAEAVNVVVVNSDTVEPLDDPSEPEKVRETDHASAARMKLPAAAGPAAVQLAFVETFPLVALHNGCPVGRETLTALLGETFVDGRSNLRPGRQVALADFLPAVDGHILPIFGTRAQVLATGLWIFFSLIGEVAAIPKTGLFVPGRMLQLAFMEILSLTSGHSELPIGGDGAFIGAA